MALPPADRYTPVRISLLAVSFALTTLIAGPALAQSSAPASAPKTAPQVQASTSPAKDAAFSPAATEAVQVVNGFMAALAGGKLEAARQQMAPDAVVIANGQVLGYRDEYINGAAKADAAALGTAQRELLRRDAKAGANFGWVLTEKRLRLANGAQSPSEVVVETMLLAKTPAGWKITHIHWSGRHG
jgi:ketosteroid isomerase-like protein